MIKNLKTSNRISLIFSIFTFFIVTFLIIFINIISYINWLKTEDIELKNGLNHQLNSEHENFLEEQIESIELELIMLLVLTMFSYILSKYLFTKIILKDIFYISEQLKNINLNNIKNIELNTNNNDEINIIGESINNFLNIINKNNINLKQFNSQVSHEFKTPLMVISSELEYLYLSGEKHESFNKIEKQVDILNNLLESFLLLTEIENFKKIEKQNILISKVFIKNIKILEKIYITKNIKVNNYIDNKSVINTNKYFFEIIIKNILDNAFKYNNKGGVINIYFSNNILKIEDNGIGINENNLDKIWNNLYRENSFGNGNGVGLNLVKKICTILNYEIKVESTQGKGTKFLLSIK